MGVPRVSNRWRRLIIIGTCISMSGWAGLKEPPREAHSKNLNSGTPSSVDKRPSRLSGPEPTTSNESELYQNYAQATDPSTQAQYLRDARDSQLENLLNLLENQENPSDVQKKALEDIKAALKARDLNVEDTFKSPSQETPEDKRAREAMAERYFEDLGGDEALKKSHPQISQEELDKIPVTEKVKALYEKATSNNRDRGGAEATKNQNPLSSDLTLRGIRSERTPNETALAPIPGRGALSNGKSFPITQLPEGFPEGNVVKPVFDSKGNIVPDKGAFSKNGGQSYFERPLPENLRLDTRTGNFFSKAEIKEQKSPSVPAPQSTSGSKPEEPKATVQFNPKLERSVPEAAPVEKLDELKSTPLKETPDSFEKQFADKTDPAGYLYLQTDSSNSEITQKLADARLGALIGGKYVVRMPATPETQKRLQEMGLAPHLQEIALDPEKGAGAFQKQLEKFDNSKEVKSLFTFVPSDGKKESFSEVDYQDPKTGEWRSRSTQVRSPVSGFSPKSYGGAEDLAAILDYGLATEIDIAAKKTEKTIQQLTGWKPNRLVVLPAATVVQGLSSQDTSGLFEYSDLTKEQSNALTRFALTTWNRTQDKYLNARLLQNAIPHSSSLRPFVSGAQLLGNVIKDSWPGMNPLSSGTPRPSKPIPAQK